MLDLESSATFTAFAGDRRLAHGDLETVVRAALAVADAEPWLVFCDATGEVIDVDLRGSADDAIARLASPPAEKPARGRPKLGVTAREVTLLPRHWQWLGAQPGGASAALRRLVDDARRSSVDLEARRRARDAAYRAMTTLAGDRPGYEEAVRALFAGETARAAGLIDAWPADIALYLNVLVRKTEPVAPSGTAGQNLPPQARIEGDMDPGPLLDDLIKG
jgi:hypothetical protein